MNNEYAELQKRLLELLAQRDGINEELRQINDKLAKATARGEDIAYGVKRED